MLILSELAKSIKKEDLFLLPNDKAMIRMHRMRPITGKVGKIGWFTDNPKFAATAEAAAKVLENARIDLDANPAKVPGLVDFWHIAAQNPLARV